MSARRPAPGALRGGRLPDLAARPTGRTTSRSRLVHRQRHDGLEPARRASSSAASTGRWPRVREVAEETGHRVVARPPAADPALRRRRRSPRRCATGRPTPAAADGRDRPTTASSPTTRSTTSRWLDPDGRAGALTLPARRRRARRLPDARRGPRTSPPATSSSCSGTRKAVKRASWRGRRRRSGRSRTAGVDAGATARAGARRRTASTAVHSSDATRCLDTVAAVRRRRRHLHVVDEPLALRGGPRGTSRDASRADARTKLARLRRPHWCCAPTGRCCRTCWRRWLREGDGRPSAARAAAVGAGRASHHVGAAAVARRGAARALTASAAVRLHGARVHVQAVRPSARRDPDGPGSFTLRSSAAGHRVTLAALPSPTYAA